LPVTGSDVFGREEDIAFLDDAWANQDINVVTIVAWAGVGKSTLVNHWLRRMAVEQYRSAQLVFGWSFYRQGTSGGTSSADEFIDAALTWFGDPDPRLGTAWEKGERLAKLISYRRTLLVLDGLEPLQNPPGPQEGRLREPSLQALLRELAAFNKGLCVITTRTPVADIADHERTSALRRDLEQLSGDAGAKLLRALGVNGYEAELRSGTPSPLLGPRKWYTQPETTTFDNISLLLLNSTPVGADVPASGDPAAAKEAAVLGSSERHEPEMAQRHSPVHSRGFPWRRCYSHIGLPRDTVCRASAP
jgi:hypothetical protein